MTEITEMTQNLPFNITAAFIIVLALLLFFVIRGFQKGLVSVIFSLVGIIFTLAVVSVITPYASEYLTDHTQFYSKMQEKSTEAISSAVQEGMSATAENQQQVLTDSGLQLPALAENRIIENANSAIYSLLESSGIFEVLGESVAQMMFRIVVFALCFIVVYIALRLLYYILNAIVALPGIRVVNKGAGALAGFIKGMLVIWILFLILSAFSATEWGAALVNSVQDNTITAYLYNNNLLLYMILAFL